MVLATTECVAGPTGQCTNKLVMVNGMCLYAKKLDRHPFTNVFKSS